MLSQASFNLFFFTSLNPVWCKKKKVNPYFLHTDICKEMIKIHMKVNSVALKVHYLSTKAALGERSADQHIHAIATGNRQPCPRQHWDIQSPPIFHLLSLLSPPNSQLGDFSCPVYQAPLMEEACS